MTDPLVNHLARALHLPPDAAQQTLHHLVSTLREQIEATGEAAVPGLGVFRRSGSHLAFEPDDALVRAVNHRYAGLAPVGAASPSSRPTQTDERSGSPAGFQPLPSFIDEDTPDVAVSDSAEDSEPTTEPDLVPEPEPSNTLDLTDQPAPASPSLEDAVVPEIPEETPEALEQAVPEASQDDASAEALFPEPPGEPSSIDEHERLGAEEDLTDAEEQPLDTEDETLDEDEPADAEPEEDLGFETLSEIEPQESEPVDADVEDEESSLDQILAGTWTEGKDAAGGEAHPLGSMPEENLEEAEYSLVDPESDEEDEDESQDGVISIITTPAPSTEEPETAHTDATEPVAPAVAAMAAVASDSTEPADELSSRGPLIAGLVVGTLLALAFLLWVRNREPAPPPVAVQPPVADTVAATSPPVDSSAAALPVDPVPELPSPDPLRSEAEIDPTSGGFTWVVGSELNRADAERRVGLYREQGFRAGVVSQEAAGRTRYRVSLGQFTTIAEAEARRADLPDDVPSDSWILRL